MIELLELELDEREQRRATRRIQEAGFPLVKTLAGFDFGRSPQLPEARIRELACGEYVDRAEQVLFIGEPGTGKTTWRRRWGWRRRARAGRFGSLRRSGW
jgi:DNA replication protein DnaC